jgi:soluble lytic murein transglycosylase-like protein
MKLRPTPTALAALGAMVTVSLVLPVTARADYAVLRSGARIQITGYERMGDSIRLTVAGGQINIAASDLVSIEPQDNFQELPVVPAAQDVPYEDLIHAAAQKHGLDEKLITEVIAVESNFNPRAVSSKNAQGLMQLLPKTARDYSVRDVFDPAQNIEAGTHYLKDLLARYRGNLKLALAAYDAGPEMVDRYGGVPPFPETQNYVRQIATKMAGLAIISPAN